MNENDGTWVRFLLRDGHLIEAVMPPADAQAWTQGWVTIAQGRYGGTDLLGRTWGFDSAHLIGLIAVPYRRFKELEKEQRDEQVRNQVEAQLMGQRLAAGAQEQAIRETSNLYSRSGR